MESIVVGIDVSKDRLDIALLPSGAAFSVDRNAKGLDLLCLRLKELSPQLIALEATGGFETVVTAALASAKLPVVVVNPAQVRALLRRWASAPKPIGSMRRLLRALPKPPSLRCGLYRMNTPSFWPIWLAVAGKSSR